MKKLAESFLCPLLRCWVGEWGFRARFRLWRVDVVSSEPLIASHQLVEVREVVQRSLVVVELQKVGRKEGRCVGVEDLLAWFLKPCCVEVTR